MEYVDRSRHLADKCISYGPPVECTISNKSLLFATINYSSDWAYDTNLNYGYSKLLAKTYDLFSNWTFYKYWNLVSRCCSA